MVLYSDEAKINLLSIDSNLINKFTSISKEISIEMVKKCSILFNNNLSISFTGNSESDSVSKNSKYKTVFVSLLFNKKILSKEINFSKKVKRNCLIKKTIKISILWIIEVLKKDIS